MNEPTRASRQAVLDLAGDKMVECGTSYSPVGPIKNGCPSDTMALVELLVQLRKELGELPHERR
ncbi:hypothetical protein OHA79_03355 [Streptomyces sp. NBC_00841]|uniref:hypothetical protein n=1 Tax=Streptomyces sp. NBC_00841 TaxID=2975847 RepID=UPI002DD814AE|nr:hypothetical protein [Streptomyces sp. NBC_00841]WRZ97047.1 hypothetical protein OHA79_03355 [Streptomyces sp. NBC_00841]